MTENLYDKFKRSSLSLRIFLDLSTAFDIGILINHTNVNPVPIIFDLINSRLR